ncbi:MAG: DUF3189 family protein [Syntrophomonadaceae bacterium]|jgi:hypothetical protein
MKIVYFDFGGSHSSVLAANIHTGQIGTTPPFKEQIMALPYFDKTTPSDFGKLKYVGDDPQDNQVYALGTKQSDCLNVLEGLVDLMEIGDRFVFADTMPYVNLTMRIGGWISRALALTSIGRPIVLQGTKDIFPHLVGLVERTKLQIAQGDGQ